MSNTNRGNNGWKQRVARKVVNYGTTFAYLAVFFGAFTSYRRLILAEYDISYLEYGISLVEAFVLTKIIQLGDRLHLGWRFGYMPLIYPTVYKSVIYTGWVGIFKLAEYAIKGVSQGKGVMGGFDELEKAGVYAFFAKCVVIFSAFIPFFAFKELARVLGEGRISELFFRRKVVRVLDRPAARVLGMRRTRQNSQ
jgi:hypothetical protein